MRVILHENDYPLIECIIGDDRVVVFLTPDGERTYPFEEVRLALLEFIEKTTGTRNVTIEEIMRGLEKE